MSDILSSLAPWLGNNEKLWIWMGSKGVAKSFSSTENALSNILRGKRAPLETEKKSYTYIFLNKSIV